MVRLGHQNKPVVILITETAPDLFLGAQQVIERLTNQVHELDEDLKAHKLRNGDLSTSSFVSSK